MATEWQNGVGKSKWQPTLANGDRMWWVYLWGEPDGKQWTGLGNDDRTSPVLHSSRRKAERVEGREQKRRDRVEYVETFEEVRRG